MMLGYWVPAFSPGTLSNDTYVRSSACLVPQATERFNRTYTASSTRILGRESGLLTAWPRSDLPGVIRSILFRTPRANGPTRRLKACFHRMKSNSFGRWLIASWTEPGASFPPFAAGRAKWRSRSLCRHRLAGHRASAHVDPLGRAIQPGG